jgi:hypothetical protein
MKNVIFLLLVIGAIGCSDGQKLKDSDIPAPVKSKFAALYPGVKDITWEMEDGKYEAGFEQNKVETSVVIDASGNLTETETALGSADLPQTVQTYCDQNFKGKTIKEASLIISAAGDTTYEAEVDNVDYIFDAQGNFVKKISETEKDEKD